MTVTRDSLFDRVVPADRSPRRHGESLFDFLNRSGSAYFVAVRDLIDDWYTNVPPEHRPALRGAVRSSDASFDSAFWELFLHEAYMRAGFDVEIHPPISDAPTHPDFRVARDGQVFYVEATSVGQKPTEVGEEARRAELHRALSEVLIVDFKLGLEVYTVGPQSVRARRLRPALQRWLGSLDVRSVTRAAGPNPGHDAFPRMKWDDQGWSLVLTALPLAEHARGVPRSALGMWGAGSAIVVDNVTGLRRVLASKVRRYPNLSAPLVIAVQSNTDFPTRDYEIEEVLYGTGLNQPPAAAEPSNTLLSEGFWVGRGTWRNGHVPQIITAAGLRPWNAATAQPALWRTYEPGADLPEQPAWLTPVVHSEHGMHREVGAAMFTHFGLEHDWPAPGDPDFDLDDTDSTSSTQREAL